MLRTLTTAATLQVGEVDVHEILIEYQCCMMHHFCLVAGYSFLSGVVTRNCRAKRQALIYIGDKIIGAMGVFLPSVSWFKEYGCIAPKLQFLTIVCNKYAKKIARA